MDFSLTAHPPFSFSAVVTSHGWADLAPFVRSEQNATLSYVARLASGRVVEIRLMDGRTGVRVDVDGDLSANEQHETEAAVTWMLALDQDFTAFYAAAQSEPKLAQVVEKAQGRVLRSPTLFEDVVKTILTTNTIWGSTKRMVKNVVQQFGEPLPGQPERRAFPTPERLAETDAETLRNATRLGYRAPYILDLARRVASGALDLEALKAADLPTLELRKRLLALKGVGNYAAANLLMILGRSDFIPIDSWALTMVSREWYGGQPVTPAQVEAAFARWGQWKGLAYWFWDWKQA